MTGVALARLSAHIVAAHKVFTDLAAVGGRRRPIGGPPAAPPFFPNPSCRPATGGSEGLCPSRTADITEYSRSFLAAKRPHGADKQGDPQRAHHHHLLGKCHGVA